LPTCPVCGYLIIDESATVCPDCGARIKAEVVENEENETPEVRLEEENTDARTPSYSDHSSTPSGGSEELIQLCDPGEFIGAAEETSDPEKPDDKPIGQTSSPLPPQVESPAGQEDTQAGANDENTDKLKKLSPEQAEQIRSSLVSDPNKSSSATPEDASRMMTNVPKNPTGPEDDQKAESGADPEDDATSRQPSDPSPENQPDAADSSEPSTQAFEGVQKTPSVRRIAYFHKNFIQLTGAVHPSTGEELVIDDRYYLLKPKKIKHQYTIIAFSALLAILLFLIGRQFISPTLPGSGSVIGVALDEDGRPLISGSEVSLPEAGKKVKTDAQGFFRFDNVPTGTYFIRCSAPNETVGMDNVSVVNDKTTTLMISLGLQEERPSATASSGGYTAPPVSAGRQQVQPQKTREEPPQKSQKTQKAASKKEYSSLRLKSNVESPRLVAGSQVLGVGNLTYKKLKPGKHRVEVTKDGYKKWKGTVNLKPNKTYVLDVTLEKLQQEPAKPTYSAEDFYQSGLAMLTDGNTASAIEDFTEAINLKPSMADAYANRARAYQIAGSALSAENDYVRAGEIFASQKRYETARQMFSGGLDLNKKSIPALINMAGLYKNKNDNDKAIKTYKEILKYDKNNFRANFELGKLYFSMHKNKWADKYLRNAHDADPNIPEVYHYLMLNYFARDDFRKVKKTYADFKLSVSEDKFEQFKDNPRFEPIIRVVGEYERP